MPTSCRPPIRATRAERREARAVVEIHETQDRELPRRVQRRRVRLGVRRAFDGVLLTMATPDGQTRLRIRLSRVEALAFALQTVQATVPTNPNDEETTTMAKEVCCVCGDPGEPCERCNGRPIFCDSHGAEHRARLHRDRAGGPSSVDDALAAALLEEGIEE